MMKVKKIEMFLKDSMIMKCIWRLMHYHLEQIPKNYNNLNHRKDKDLWEKAMIRKIESVNRNNT